jgi:hypothetical protein
VRAGSTLVDICGILTFDDGPLLDPFGYVYRIDTSTGVYVGQHKFRRGEHFETYKGSGTHVKKFATRNLSKSLVVLAQSQAELDLHEMVEIARVRCELASASPVRMGTQWRKRQCLNVLDGGKHRFHRRVVEAIVFGQRLKDSEFVREVTLHAWQECLSAVRDVTSERT